MSTAATLAASLRCTIVTPEETVLDTGADFVALPLYDGELGVAKDHSPLIGRLGYGELRIRLGNVTSRYYIDGGFVQVNDNLVSVLTNRAISSAAVDETLAAEQLAAALVRPTRSAEELVIRDRAIARSRAQITVAMRHQKASNPYNL